VPSEREFYEIRLEDVLARIKDGGYGLVGFQMPDGLKFLIPEIASRIESETTATPVFCTEPCFGACDVSESLPRLGCDLVVHMGHSKMTEVGDVPIIYVPCFSLRSAEEVLKANVGRLPTGRIGLVASLQHVRDLPRLGEILADGGISPVIGESGSRTEYPGQVLGCNYQSARNISEDVDAYLYVGGGNFHPLGIALATGKEVFVLDPYRCEMRDICQLVRKTLHRRFAQIENSRGSRSIGLLVSTKPGQRRMEEALACLKKLRERGIRSELLSYERLDPSRLVAYDFDSYVNFGCPRMAVDDSELFHRPVLTPKELEVMLGERTWEDYVPDEIT
jgi:2-(3-amino-3-carboxypropyl)histidine synthase